MSTLCIGGYFIIIVFSCLFDISIIQTSNARYNAFFAMNALPSFSQNGKVGNITCNGLFLCSHFQCKMEKQYISLEYPNNCDITLEGMISRWQYMDVESILSIQIYTICLYGIIGTFFVASIIIVTVSVSKVPVSLNTIGTVISMILDISTSMYQIYCITVINSIRPSLPNYYSLRDDDLVMYQIVIICSRLVISLFIFAYLSYIVSQIRPEKVTSDIHTAKETFEALFFTRSEPLFVPQDLNEKSYLVEEQYSDNTIQEFLGNDEER